MPSKWMEWTGRWHRHKIGAQPIISEQGGIRYPGTFEHQNLALVGMKKVGMKARYRGIEIRQ